MNTARIDSSSLPFRGMSDAAASRAALANGDRAPKLDLLLHLLANLNQSIMLVGPDGVGKTILLRQIQAQAHAFWEVCYVSSTANLSLGRIMDEMRQLLRKPGQTLPDGDVESWLEEQLTAFSRQDQTLVLLLDNAGILMPGLLGALCRFARRHPALRLVFTLRPEDIPVKASTDALAVTDSHEVYLSSLAETDGEVFQSQPAAQRLPEQASSSAPKFLLVSGLLLAVLVAFAVALFLWRRESEPPSAAMAEPAKVSEVVRTPPSNDVELGSLRTSVAPAQPSHASEAMKPQAVEARQAETVEPQNVVQSPIATNSPQSQIITPVQKNSLVPQSTSDTPPEIIGQPAQSEKPDNKAEISQPILQPSVEEKPSEPDKNTGASPDSKERIEKPPLTPEEQLKHLPSANPSGHLISGVKDGNWLMQQDPNAYTLQLVAVSQLGALVKFIERIPASDELATFRSRKGKGDLYPLFYGIYPNLAAAKDASNRWPSTLGKPYPRQLKSIQQEIRRVTPKNADSIIPFQ